MKSRQKYKKYQILSKDVLLCRKGKRLELGL